MRAPACALLQWLWAAQAETTRANFDTRYPLHAYSALRTRLNGSPMGKRPAHPSSFFPIKRSKIHYMDMKKASIPGQESGRLNAALLLECLGCMQAYCDRAVRNCVYCNTIHIRSLSSQFPCACPVQASQTFFDEPVFALASKGRMKGGAPSSGLSRTSSKPQMKGRFAVLRSPPFAHQGEGQLC